MDRPRIRYSESELRQIISRALREPVDGYSQADLEAAAKEIGIDKRALDAAIARVTERPSSILAVAKGVLAPIAIGGALGVLAPTLGDRFTPGVSIAAAVSVPLLLFIAGMFVRPSDRRKRDAVLQFEAKNLGLWGAYLTASFASAAVLNPHWWFRFGGEMTVICTALASIAALAGGLVVALRTPGVDEGPTDRGASTWPAKLVRRVKRWIDHVLSRVRVRRVGYHRNGRRSQASSSTTISCHAREAARNPRPHIGPEVGVASLGR